MPAIPDGLCYLNGEFGPLQHARVSVMDRGFLLGDGVFEELPVYGRRLFLFDGHLARLERNLQKARIGNPLSAAEWRACCERLVAAHENDDQLLHLQLTRGAGPQEPAMPVDASPTVFIMSRPLKLAGAEVRHQGVACVTARDFRWERLDIQSTSMFAHVLARQLSVDQGAVETLLFRNGFLSGASCGEAWIVHEGAVLGPPPRDPLHEDPWVRFLRALCEEEGLAFNLRPLPETEVLAADEIILSGASRELLPVTRLDGEPVGHGALRGKPGSICARLHAAYQRAKLARPH